MSLERFYKKFALSRPMLSADGVSYANTLVGNFKGFLQPVSGAEFSLHQKLDDRIDAKLFCPVAVPAKYGDVVTYSGESWRVVWASGQYDGISSVNNHKEILLTRYGDGG